MNKKQQSGTLHLTQKTHYGLFLLVTLAKNPDQNLSIKTISKQNHIPFAFLQKIASNLQKGKIIKANRGKYGGYVLIKDPQKITLKKIIETLEGPVALASCLDPTCHTKCNKEANCIIKNGLKKINNEIKNQLLSKKLTYFFS